MSNDQKPRNTSFFEEMAKFTWNGTSAPCGIEVPDYVDTDPVISLHQSDIDTFVDLIYDEVRVINLTTANHIGFNLSPNSLSVIHVTDKGTIFYKSMPISGVYDLDKSHAGLSDTYYYLRTLKG